MFTEPLLRDATKILSTCQQKGLKLATAESCTGGLISALFTEIPGSSDVFDRGFICYSNASKTDLLGVDKKTIAEFGAVSSEVAAAMAQGAFTRAGVDIALSVTGIAGPGGGTPEKPVGLVYIAIAAHDSIIVENNHFTGSRADIRLQSAAKVFAMLEDRLSRTFAFVA